MFKIKRFFLLLFLCVVISGCQTAPYTGRSQFIITSEEQETALGDEAWKQVKETTKPSTNPKYTEPVARVGKNLSKAVDEKSYDWQFMVVDSEEMNAFCLPGGKVVVYTGLFQFISNDAELASVMGHEIGHAIARHGGERITQQYMKELGGSALGVALSSAEVSPDWVSVYGVAADLGMILPYSREHEYEGDYIGIMLMAEAGYDPEAAVSFFRKFSTIQNYGAVEEFFATHPMGEKRVEELKKILEEARQVYALANPKRGLGVIYASNAENGTTSSSNSDNKPSSEGQPSLKTSVTRSRSEIFNMVASKNINSDSNPQDITEIFLPDDNSIYIFFNTKNVNAADTITAKWQYMSENKWVNITVVDLEPPDNTSQAHFFMKRKETNLWPVGEYRVEIFVKGVPKATKYFTVESSGDNKEKAVQKRHSNNEVITSENDFEL